MIHNAVKVKSSLGNKSKFNITYTNLQEKVTKNVYWHCPGSNETLIWKIIEKIWILSMTVRMAFLVGDLKAAGCSCIWIFCDLYIWNFKINNLKKLKDRNSITHTSSLFKTCSTAAVILLSSRGVVFTSSMTCVTSLSILLSGNLSNYRAIFLRHSVLNAAHTCSIGFSGLE